MFELGCFIIGVIVLSKFVLGTFAPAFYRHFLRSPLQLTKLGKYVVVTGATDGIGRALAFEAAKKGMNLLLISRTQSKLEEMKQELLGKYPSVTVEILALDCAKVATSVELRNTIQDTLEKKCQNDIALLINNVGISYEFPQYFDELSDDRVSSLISLNVSCATWMTKMVLPAMKNKKKGAIINISSGSASFNVPLLSQYSATKKYMEQITVCLAKEYPMLHIECHTPMFVTTKLAKIRHASFMIPSPSTFAKVSLAALGSGQVLTSPYWPHAVQIWFYSTLPEVVMAFAAMKTHLSLRKRALKKLEQKKNN